MRRFSSWLTLAALAAFTLGAAGCNPEATTAPSSASSETDHGHDGHDHDHDGHDHGDDHEGHDHVGHDHDDMTLASLLGEIDETRSDIAAAFEKGSPGDAHGSMHSVGHLLDDLTVAGKKQTLDEDQMKQLEAAKKSLLDAFGAIDAGMHGAEGKTYAEVEDDILSAMKTLQGFVPSTTE